MSLLSLLPLLSHTKSDFDNIHTDIKASNDKHNSDIKSMSDQISDMNDHICAILAKVTDTRTKIDKQEGKTIDLSSKLSTY